MSAGNERRILAALVALLVFVVAYLLISLLAFVVLPDTWSVEDYSTVSEYMAEQGSAIVEIVVPGLVAALVYRLIKGEGDNGHQPE